MTTVTVVAEDRRIIVDGEVLTFDFPISSEIWAVQWDGTKGHIEYRDGRMPEVLSSQDAVAPYIVAHAAEKHRQLQERETAEAAATYARLRDPRQRLAELADIRWQHQSTGIMVEGMRLRTDRESIVDLRAIADRSAEKFPLSYKAATEFVTLESKEQATHYADAQDTHVQACFDYEAVLAKRIAALINDPEALAAFDLAEGWPAS